MTNLVPRLREGASRAGALLRRWRVPLGLGCVLAVVELVYVVIVSAGKLTEWPTYMNYNDLLAEGFRSGHLHLSLEPAPELIAQENPLDPKNSAWWLGDASYYRGHFYLYFGPLPALLLAAVKSLFRISASVGDQELVFAFFSLAALAGAVLIHRLTKRLHGRAPFLLVAASILAFSLTNPILHLLASSSIYQSAVSGGQAFLIVGVALAFEVISTPPERRLRAWQLWATGTAFVFAIACRLTLAPGVAVLVVLTVLGTGLGEVEGRWRRRARAAVWLSAPVILGCVGLIVYNKLRFDAWLDFGHSKQMTTWPVTTSPRYLAANVFTYLLRPLRASCQFPFALVPYEMQLARALPSWMSPPEGYGAPEPVAGFLMTSAFSWTIPIALMSAFARFRALRAHGADPMALSSEAQTRDRAYLWCVAVFVAMGTVSGALPLVFYMATMRYLADMSFGWALLGILGIWSMYGAARSPRLRALAVSVGAILCAATVVFGLLLGYQGYGEHFKRSNTALHDRLVRSLSVCRFLAR